MLALLENRSYRHLFLAQVCSLLGTGLGTIALGLLAFDLAGRDAGIVLGTAFAIKMIAYVGLAPVAGAFTGILPRRTVLVALDITRAAIALALPFVTEVWQVYVLIFILQASSACFTPVFQATIPEVLPDEREYTRALTLSRIAYDLESLASPILAGALLAFLSFHELFFGMVAGFAVSAFFLLSMTFPALGDSTRRGIYDRTTRGMRIYFRTPRLRGLLGVSLAVSVGGSIVIVNTVVYVQSVFGLTPADTAIAYALFGAGSMVVALTLPYVLDRVPDRTLLLSGGVLLGCASVMAAFISGFQWLLAVWFLIGCGYSMALTPSGRLLKRSAHAEDRPALFAAQFALSHLCWLFAYPVAGWLGAAWGMTEASLLLAFLAFLGTVSAYRLWPAEDNTQLAHSHPDLPPDHPHLESGKRLSQVSHSHPYVIDDLHFMWPNGR
jgi:MFS family permease